MKNKTDILVFTAILAQSLSLQDSDDEEKRALGKFYKHINADGKK